MYYIYSFVLGMLVKLFDEIVDLGIKVEDFYIELIKGFILLLFILLGIDDFAFSLSMGVTFFGSWLVGGIDTAFWKVTTVIIGVLAVISASPLDHLAWKIIPMMVMPFAVAIEAIMYPEEHSLRKIINRIGSSAFIALLFIPPVHSFLQNLNGGDLRFGEKQVLSVIGYYLVSICFQFYFMWNKASDKAESSPDLQPRSESSETSHSSYGFLDYCRDWYIW